MRLLIKDGCVVDPSQDLGEVADILIVGGRIAEIAGGLTSTAIDPQIPGTQVIDAAGCMIAPGFVDMHCHLREPGFEDKETIASGTQAAARGGFTTVCAMPNTVPPPDTVSGVRHLLGLAGQDALVRVFPVATITKGRAGHELAEMAELREAGAVAFSDDGSPVANGQLMRHALLYSTMLDVPLLAHCEDLNLSQDAAMHEGPLSTMLGLQGYPAAAEVSAVARDIALAELCGGRLHICHVSTAGAVDLVRQAKARGVQVTAEVTPHHLLLTEAWVAGSMFESLSLGGSNPLLSIPPDFPPYHTSTKVNPPLRTRKDIEGLWQGLRDGTIDAIATDHAPHTWVDKECEYALAAPGISGLETALSMLLQLSHRNIVDLSSLVGALSCNPAHILGLSSGTLQVGRPADIVIFDPEEEWTVQPEEFVSKGKNSPLMGTNLRGRVRWTLVDGQVVWGSPPISGKDYKPKMSALNLAGWLLGTSDLIDS